MKSNREAMAASRQRRKDAGLIPVTVWTFPENREKLTRYVQRTNQRTKQKGTP